MAESHNVPHNVPKVEVKQIKTQYEIDQEFLQAAIFKLNQRFVDISLEDAKASIDAVNNPYFHAINAFLAKEEIRQAFTRTQATIVQGLQQNEDDWLILNWLKQQNLLSEQARKAVIAKFDELDKASKAKIAGIKDPADRRHAAKLAGIFSNCAEIMVASLFIDEGYMSPEKFYGEKDDLLKRTDFGFAALAFTEIYSCWREFSAGIAEISNDKKFSGGMRVAKAFNSLATAGIAIYNIVMSQALEPIVPNTVLGLTITLGFRACCSLLVLSKSIADYANGKIGGKEFTAAINDFITDTGKFAGFFVATLAHALSILSGPGGFILMAGAGVLKLLVQAIIAMVPDPDQKAVLNNVVQQIRKEAGDGTSQNDPLMQPDALSSSPPGHSPKQTPSPSGTVSNASLLSVPFDGKLSEVVSPVRPKSKQA